MQNVGKLNIDKIGRFEKLIETDIVIITDERIKHINERHPRRIQCIF